MTFYRRRFFLYFFAAAFFRICCSFLPLCPLQPQLSLQHSVFGREIKAASRMWEESTRRL